MSRSALAKIKRGLRESAAITEGKADPARYREYLPPNASRVIAGVDIIQLQLAAFRLHNARMRRALQAVLRAYTTKAGEPRKVPDPDLAVVALTLAKDALIHKSVNEDG